MLIRQLQLDPTRLHNKEVTIRARVRQAWAKPYPHYWASDGRDERDYVHVACARGAALPAIGTTVVVRGRLHAGPYYVAPNGHEQSGAVVIITEKTRAA